MSPASRSTSRRAASARATAHTVTTYRPTTSASTAATSSTSTTKAALTKLLPERCALPGHRHGARRTSSFIANNATNNGDPLPATDVSASDGFARNAHEELLLQSTLATGADATPDSARGACLAEPGCPAASRRWTSAGQTRVKRDGDVALSVYCDLIGRPCSGTIALRAAGATLGTAPLSAATGHVSTVRIRSTRAPRCAGCARTGA